MDQEAPDPGNPQHPILPAGQDEAPQAITSCGCRQLDQDVAATSASVADSAPSQDLLEIVPDSIVAAELGSNPHCMPAHWPRKAPAP